MNKYQQQISQINSDCFENMPEQITIDYIEECELELVTEAAEEGIDRELIGSWHYKVDTLLEVMNPELKTDIELLSRLEKVLDEYTKDQEFVDGVLGIKL